MQGSQTQLIMEGDCAPPLEKRMKCGIGICGRCNIGSNYVCVDGPVFSNAKLHEMLPEL